MCAFVNIFNATKLLHIYQHILCHINLSNKFDVGFEICARNAVFYLHETWFNAMSNAISRFIVC